MTFIHRSCCSGGVREKIAFDMWFLLIDLSMARIRANCKRLWTPCKASQTVQKVCHRLLIFFKGREAISEAGWHLASAGLCLWQVATFGKDLELVRVVCFHTSMMAQKKRFCNRLCDTSSTGRDRHLFGRCIVKLIHLETFPLIVNSPDICVFFVIFF